MAISMRGLNQRLSNELLVLVELASEVALVVTEIDSFWRKVAG
jgi:hypothetical protein